MNEIQMILFSIVAEAVRRDERGNDVAAVHAVFVDVGIELGKLFKDTRFTQHEGKD